MAKGCADLKRERPKSLGESTWDGPLGELNLFFYPSGTPQSANVEILTPFPAEKFFQDLVRKLTGHTGGTLPG